MPGHQKKKKTSKAKAPFFPNSPSSVGSPRNDGFYPRSVRQRTPTKLCSLVLPPPLISLFSNSGGNDVTATTATGRLTVSDNASLDGYSIIDNATHARHSSNASAVSASVASVGGIGSSGSTVHHSPHLPLHLRVGMAPCDPLLVFGRFVLVGTCDGRIAIYSIVDFGNRSGISEDVEASERRRRAEWKEEDAKMMAQQQMKGEEEKKDQSNSQSNAKDNENEVTSDVEDDEENESDMRDRMHQREKAKQSVEPILIVTLPKKNGSGDDQNNSSYDEESTISTGNISLPPTIVAMCATPGSGTSLIEQRDITMADDRTEMLPTSSRPLMPSLGNALLGHVAVLTDDGEVHVLEFLHQPPVRVNDFLQGSEARRSDTNEKSINHVPIVNAVVSFSTGYLGATCICVFGNGTESVQMRLCIGHQSGILASFQIYSRCIHPGVRNVNSSHEGDDPSFTSPGTSFQDDVESLTRSKSNDFQDTGQSSTTKAVSPVLFRKTETSANPEPDSLREMSFKRTLSEPIAVSEIDKSELAPVVGPARVELCWRGKFNVPIRSLSSPGWGRPSKEETQLQDALLVVGVEQRERENATNPVPVNGIAPSLPHHSISPAISLEVINATLAEQLWCQIKNEPATISDDRKCVPLYDCSVWPAAGKEIKDGWMRGAPRRGVDPRDKLFGALGIQRTSITNRMCCFEGPDPCFASASSDGTVVISHFREDGSWGVMEEDNQIMMCERCIGIGIFDYDSNLSSYDLDGRYVACCMRGGTIYLVPVAEPSTKISTRAMGQSDITMLTFPLDPDGDDDGLVRFVQSFSAGMAHVLHWKCGSGKESSHLMGNITHGAIKSVAMVGWPGGIIDVYEVNVGLSRGKSW